jgi:hypothetical protein
VKRRAVTTLFSFGLAASLILGWVNRGQAGMMSRDIPQAATLLPPVVRSPPLLTGQSSLFRFVRTVPVTPDEHFVEGDFVRVNYVPATDRMVVNFATRQIPPQTGNCPFGGLAYKEYNLDMARTGQFGVLNCEMPDFGSNMVDNTFYFVSMHGEQAAQGWRIIKYNAATWEKIADIFFPLNYPEEGNGDPMVAYVNGQLDVSAGYNPAGSPPPGIATHHEFFSTALEFQGKRYLTDTAHYGGASLLYVDNVYHYVTADAFDGDLVVMQYAPDWTYLGAKPLIAQAHWSTGLVYDGQRFYVAYLDTSQRTEPGFLPVFLNVHLAAFDRAWNLVDDIAVTNYTREDLRQPGRPWVTLHNNRLYVSYDLDTIDPVTYQEQHWWQAYVSVYELLHTVYLPLALRN